MTTINSLYFSFLSLFLSFLSSDSLSFPFLSLRQRERKGRSRKEENKERKRKEKGKEREYIVVIFPHFSLFFFFSSLFSFSFFFLLSSTDCQRVVPCRFSSFWKLSLKKVCSSQSLYFIRLFSKVFLWMCPSPASQFIQISADSERFFFENNFV